MVRCGKCNVELVGNWEMELDEDADGEIEGASFGIPDGWFLSGEDGWVYCYCYPCWKEKVKENINHDTLVELSKLKDQKELLRKEITKQQTKKATFEEDIAKLIEHQTTLRKATTTLANDRNQLLAACQENIHKFTQDQAEFRKDITKLQGEIKTLEQAKTDLENQLANLERSKGVLIAQLQQTTKSRNNEKIGAQLQKTTESRNNEKIGLNENREQLNNEKGMLDATEERLDNEKVQLEKTNQELNEKAEIMRQEVEQLKDLWDSFNTEGLASLSRLVKSVPEKDAADLREIGFDLLGLETNFKQQHKLFASRFVSESCHGLIQYPFMPDRRD